MTTRREAWAAIAGVRRAAGLAVAGLGLAASAQADLSQSYEPLPTPGLYAVTVKPILMSEEDRDLNSLLPQGLGEYAFETRECVTAQDAASLPDFARSLHKSDRLEACALELVADDAWRARCGSSGMDVIHEGSALFRPRSFTVVLTTTIGRTSVDTLVAGEWLSTECPP